MKLDFIILDRFFKENPQLSLADIAEMKAFDTQNPDITDRLNGGFNARAISGKYVSPDEMGQAKQDVTDCKNTTLTRDDDKSTLFKKDFDKGLSSNQVSDSTTVLDIYELKAMMLDNATFKQSLQFGNLHGMAIPYINTLISYWPIMCEITWRKIIFRICAG